MGFDKEEYWKNRKSGKRGQGEELDSPASSPSLRQGRGRRRKPANRYYKNEEDTEGKKYTQKGVRHKDGSKPFTPAYDPMMSNNQRVRKRRIARGRLR